MLFLLHCLADGDKPLKGSHSKLGSAGLALHYANIITQIDTLVRIYISTCNFKIVLSLCSVTHFLCITNFRARKGYKYFLLQNSENYVFLTV